MCRKGVGRETLVSLTVWLSTNNETKSQWSRVIKSCTIFWTIVAAGWWKEISPTTSRIYSIANIAKLVAASDNFLSISPT